MKSKELEKTLKLEQVEHICTKHLVRCPATSDQAALKAMAITILNIIREQELTVDNG